MKDTLTEYLFALLSFLGAIPIATLAKKLSLRSKVMKDYAYYLEWRDFSILKVIILKPLIIAIISSMLLALRVSADKSVFVLSILLVCGFIAELTLVIGRPHPTPSYIPSKVACEGCKGNEHEECDNLRMLDSFETGFKSRDGLYRPVCCCGFRIGAWNEIEI